MIDSVARFYDELAPYYHLVYADWRKTVLRHAAALDKLIRLRKGAPPLSLLDCSCGIGTQAIGLALRGYRVHGTDLSPVAVERARREAASFGVSPSFAVADFRALDTQVAGTFEVLISCDNALPHLLTDDDLRRAVESMRSKLRGDGLLLVSIRDYERLLDEKPRTTMPDVREGPEGMRIIFQAWEWLADAPMYRVHYFILREHHGQWHTFHQTMVYRPLLREDLGRHLQEAGFADTQWHMPEDTGYFQPVVTALRRA